MAAFSELNLEQYANFSTTVNVEDTSGAAINLFGYSAASQIRKSYYSTTATNFTASITSPFATPVIEAVKFVAVVE